MSEYTTMKGGTVHEIAALKNTIEELRARNLVLVKRLDTLGEERDLLRKELDDANDYAEGALVSLQQETERANREAGEYNRLSHARDVLLFEYGIAHSFIPADEVASFLERISLSRQETADVEQ